MQRILSPYTRKRCFTFMNALPVLAGGKEGSACHDKGGMPEERIPASCHRRGKVQSASAIFGARCPVRRSAVFAYTPLRGPTTRTPKRRPGLGMGLA
jgi:hypothetical protein